MSVTIRLRRVGRKKQPSYRVVVIPQAAPRDGSYLDAIGFYNPRRRPRAELRLDLARVDYWVSKGAGMSDTVASLVRKARKGGDDKVEIFPLSGPPPGSGATQPAPQSAPAPAAKAAAPAPDAATSAPAPAGAEPAAPAAEAPVDSAPAPADTSAAAPAGDSAQSAGAPAPQDTEASAADAADASAESAAEAPQSAPDAEAAEGDEEAPKE